MLHYSNEIIKLILKQILISLLLSCIVINNSCAESEGENNKTEERITKSEIELLRGRYNPKTSENFVKITSDYALKKSLYLNKEAFEAFLRMAEAAKKDSINIYILSATRDFNAQKSIWEAKFNGQRKVGGKNLKKSIINKKDRALKILEYSSMPGTSRHHWGTDFDIAYSNKNYSKALTNEAYESAEGKALYLWLEKNAHKYGFCQPYQDSPEKRNSNIKRGYFEEKWHWSYVPLAKKYLILYKNNKDLFKPVGFEGDSFSEEFYMDFVLNISGDCL
ncbi:MAG: M15 family metallopeptidase [Spirochaetia bacterium]|nr:M15 family metallopeptidase [Spirochaetia bacterium]